MTGCHGKDSTAAASRLPVRPLGITRALTRRRSARYAWIGHGRTSSVDPELDVLHPLDLEPREQLLGHLLPGWPLAGVLHGPGVRHTAGQTRRALPTCGQPSSTLAAADLALCLSG